MHCERNKRIELHLMPRAVGQTHNGRSSAGQETLPAATIVCPRQTLQVEEPTPTEPWFDMSQ